jgi:hypothetical protein
MVEQPSRHTGFAPKPLRIGQIGSTESIARNKLHGSALRQRLFEPGFGLPGVTIDQFKAQPNATIRSNLRLQQVLPRCAGHLRPRPSRWAPRECLDVIRGHTPILIGQDQTLRLQHWVRQAGPNEGIPKVVHVRQPGANHFRWPAQRRPKPGEGGWTKRCHGHDAAISQTTAQTGPPCVGISCRQMRTDHIDAAERPFRPWVVGRARHKLATPGC